MSSIGERDRFSRETFGDNVADDALGLDVVTATDEQADEDAQAKYDRPASEEEILYRRARHIQQDLAGVWFKASRIEKKLDVIEVLLRTVIIVLAVLAALGALAIWRLW